MGSDLSFMEQALEEAERAALAGEVPVGAVLVREGAVLARGHNSRETTGDPAGHAELVVLRQAAVRLGGWRLEGSTMYVTLEPCPMCAGALVLARVARLVFGARDPKAGACGSLMDIVRDPRLNHRLEVTEGVLGERCGAVLREFFRRRR